MSLTAPLLALAGGAVASRAPRALAAPGAWAMGAVLLEGPGVQGGHRTVPEGGVAGYAAVDDLPTREVTSMRSRQHRPAAAYARPLALLSAVLAGLLAGGMVLIEAVLLPFWRSVPPAEFRRWFTANAPRIRTLMVPLGAAAGVVGVTSAVTDVVTSRRRSPASLTAAAATVGVVAVTVTVNEPANHRFTGGSLTDAETADLLASWARWHHLRVALGVVATVAAASALPPRRP